MCVVGVDIGGTFTDLMLYDTESGAAHVHNARSTADAITRESEDFGCVICDAEARQLCESSQSTPLQSGPMDAHVAAARIGAARFLELLGSVREVEFLEPDGYSVGAFGGGYGDPPERDRAAIREDLADGVVSPETARVDYGYEEAG